MSGSDCDDYKHCECVDHLYQRIRELEAALEEIKRKSYRLDAEFYGIACRALEGKS